MKLVFNIRYKTYPGKRLFVVGSSSKLGKWNTREALKMHCSNGDCWSLETTWPIGAVSFEYKYFLANEDGSDIKWEFGDNRSVFTKTGNFDIIEIIDAWRENNNEWKILQRSAFKDVIFKRKSLYNNPKISSKISSSEITITFRISVPKLNPQHHVCLIGNQKELGEWKFEHAILMDHIKNDVWETRIQIDKTNSHIVYKYGICDTKNKYVLCLESGDDRSLQFDSKKNYKRRLRLDDQFRYSNYIWRGVGVSLPVFSLRSSSGLGVGEFLDIKLLVDWCKRTDQKLIQILPVNDTICTHTKVDSYPYGGTSVFALHPIYLRIQAVPSIPTKIVDRFLTDYKEKLNAKDHVDYEAVVKAKLQFCKTAYDAVKKTFLNTKDFQTFFEENKHWLVPYAAYSYLRDLYGTSVYDRWGKYSKFDEKLIGELVSPKSGHYDEIAIHYFIQYHLNMQLVEAVEYARANGVILKGDLPIGVNRYGVETWINPELFFLDGQTGAPPDAYAENGQNWGFPTYNWEVMGNDNFHWWSLRLRHLARYFDAIRIDHILGFFRIWEIPIDAVTGLLGHFRPAASIHRSELESMNIGFNEHRYCEPYIRVHNLYRIFGHEQIEEIKNKYLEEYAPGCFKMKQQFDTQKKIEKYFEYPSCGVKDLAERNILKDKLYELISDVLFLKDKEHPNSYHPRISIARTNSFTELDDYIKHKVYNLYIDYFYRRQEHIWREQAMIKLPALLFATNMLICGEDLGMVPDCVPGVMNDLGIISLKIQRMPKEDWLDFGIPSSYPYMSVCTPSCHDMSTIRGWWEEDAAKRQKFYNNILGHHGSAPFFCEPWICDEIIMQHLCSPSMIAIFPIQDFLATNAKLRRENPHDEKINEPANPKHYWKYRMHMTLEDLMQQQDFNNHIHSMIEKSGRNTVYY